MIDLHFLLNDALIMVLMNAVVALPLKTSLDRLKLLW